MGWQTLRAWLSGPRTTLAVLGLVLPLLHGACARTQEPAAARPGVPAEAPGDTTLDLLLELGRLGADAPDSVASDLMAIVYAQCPPESVPPTQDLPAPLMAAWCAVSDGWFDATLGEAAKSWEHLAETGADGPADAAYILALCREPLTDGQTERLESWASGPEGRARMWSAIALVRHGASGQAGALSQAVGNADPWMAAWAATAAGDAGPRGAGLVPALLDIQADPDAPPVLLRAAGEALMKLGPYADVSSLLDYVTAAEPSSLSRGVAIAMLGDAGARGGPAIEPLIRIASSANEDPACRWGAIDSLGRLGEVRREPAIRTALRALLSEDLMADDAARALAQCGDPAGLDLLCSQLASGSEDDRCLAAWAVMCLGPKARAAVGPLGSALGHRDASVREAAAQALGWVGDPASPPDALAKALADTDARVRLQAAVSLAMLGEASGVPELVAQWQSGDEYAQATALFGLRQAAPHSADAVAALESAAESDDPGVCGRAAIGLVAAGRSEWIPRAREVLSGRLSVMVRLDAAAVLLQAGDESGLALLRESAASDAWVVRERAEEILRAHGRA